MSNRTKVELEQDLRYTEDQLDGATELLNQLMALTGASHDGEKWDVPELKIPSNPVELMDLALRRFNAQGPKEQNHHLLPIMTAYVSVKPSISDLEQRRAARAEAEASGG